MRKQQLIPAMMFATVALTSCASQPEKPKFPRFVSYDSIQSNAINAGSQSASGSFTDIANRLSVAEEPQLAGTDVQVADTIVNTGAPATGIHVIVKGTAFDTGLFGSPKRGLVTTTTLKDEPGPSADLTLNQDESGAWTGDADVKCDKQIIVSFITHAKKGGTGEIQMMVKPKETGGSSSASFSHSYTVRSDGDDQNSSE
jgi:hypothetical protein